MGDWSRNYCCCCIVCFHSALFRVLFAFRDGAIRKMEKLPDKCWWNVIECVSERNDRFNGRAFKNVCSVKSGAQGVLVSSYNMAMSIAKKRLLSRASFMPIIDCIFGKRDSLPKRMNRSSRSRSYYIRRKGLGSSSLKCNYACVNRYVFCSCHFCFVCENWK